MGGGNRQKYWVGFDLGGTKMLSVLFDADFRPVARRRRVGQPAVPSGQPLRERVAFRRRHGALVSS